VVEKMVISEATNKTNFFCSSAPDPDQELTATPRPLTGGGGDHPSSSWTDPHCWPFA